MPLAVEMLEDRTTPVVFNLNPLSALPPAVSAGFAAAAAQWSAVLSDPVTVNIDIDYQPLGPGILGSTNTIKISPTYAAFKAALVPDATSADDAIAVANLQPGASFNMLINRTANSPFGAGNATPYLDNDGDANNTTIWITRANAKAIGLLPAAAPAVDATIIFSSLFAFDFTPGNGITAGQFDFVAVATHEIGHALGFVSGVDILDTNSPNPVLPAPFPDNAFNVVTPLDLYRFSAPATMDWTANATPKYFSIDNGVTNLTTFSTGFVFGDGQQASHWEDNLGIGLMDPTLAPGTLGVLTARDFQAMDVIGWDVPVPPPPPPPPGGGGGTGSVGEGSFDHGLSGPVTGAEGYYGFGRGVGLPPATTVTTVEPPATVDPAVPAPAKLIDPALIYVVDTTSGTSDATTSNGDSGEAQPPAENAGEAGGEGLPANNGGQSATAQLAPNYYPPVANDASFYLWHDQTLAGFDVRPYTYDADGNPLQIHVMDGPGTGTLTQNADGTFNYTPAKHTAGQVTFTYIASDGTFTSDVKTITLNIMNYAPVANDVGYYLWQDQSLTGLNLLPFTYDGNGDALQIEIVAPPTLGTLSRNDDGTFDYVPPAQTAGTFTFSYSVTDGVTSSNVATVTLTVLPIEPAPSIEPPPAPQTGPAVGSDIVIGIVDDGVNSAHAPAVTQVAVSVVGDAFNPQFVSILGGTLNDAADADALAYQRNFIDIYNSSWGPIDDGMNLTAPGPLTQAALQAGVHLGRDSLGSIFVWAAGNGLTANDNVNYDGFANSRFVIAVSALDPTGVQAFYSEPGAPILVTAPGTVNTGDYVGYQGTSFSAPVVTGVVAQMLKVNPNLTWRDVQAILVHSATKIDLADSDWVANGAGLLVNHKYGFGEVNAAAAVALASSWTNVGPEVAVDSGTTTVDAVIPDNDSAGVTSTITIPTNVSVEHVEVEFNATHPQRGQLRVVLTSPAGTQSVLAEAHSDTGSDYHWTFTSVHDWGEQSQGNWTLTVTDLSPGATGTWDSWSLKVYGSATASAAAPNGSISTDSTSVSFGEGAFAAGRSTVSGAPFQIEPNARAGAQTSDTFAGTRTGDADVFGAGIEFLRVSDTGSSIALLAPLPADPFVTRVNIAVATSGALLETAGDAASETTLSVKGNRKPGQSQGQVEQILLESGSASIDGDA